MVTAGLLVLRLVLGLTMAAHGAQKLFGWSGAPGLGGFAAVLERIGIRPGRTWALVSALVEFGGGLLVAAGLVTPIVALVVAGNLLVAILTVHVSKGFWNQAGGFEYPLALLAGMVAISLVGPGPASLDALLGLALVEPWTWVATAAVVLLGAAATGALPRLRAARRPPLHTV